MQLSKRESVKNFARSHFHGFQAHLHSTNRRSKTSPKAQISKTGTASFSSKPDSPFSTPSPSPVPMASLRAEEFRPVNTVLAHDKFKPFESGAGLT